MKYFFISLLLSGFSCKTPLDINYIKSKVWDHEKGFRIGDGDLIVFEKKLSLFDIKDDTIYFKGSACAIIKELDKKNYTLIVKSLDNDERGQYRNIEESLGD